MNKKSLLGYRKDSPYKNEPFIEIEGNLIDMSGVSPDVTLLAVPDKGKPKLLKGGTGNFKFKGARKVTEIPIYQQGGTNTMSGLAGETTVPVSPFMSLKPFINKYKLKHGGVIDYMSTLPLEQQYQFAEEFDSFDKDTQAEVEEYLKGGYYQMGGVSESQRGDLPPLDINNITEGIFYVPDDQPELLEQIIKQGYAYNKL